MQETPSTSSNPSATEAVAGSGDARAFAIEVARIAHDNKTEDVRVLDLRGLSGLADFFVLGTGTSDRQMRAVVDLVGDYAKTIDRTALSKSERSSSWMLADFVDVVLHLFDEEHREYYDLDSLWGDADEIEWRDAARAESADQD